jgi:hypothetical protein
LYPILGLSPRAETLILNLGPRDWAESLLLLGVAYLKLGDFNPISLETSFEFGNLRGMNFGLAAMEFLPELEGDAFGSKFRG